MAEGKTKIQEIECAEDVKDFVNLNPDVSVTNEIKAKINSTQDDELLIVDKTIGSHITIDSVNLYNEEFFLENF